MVVALSRQPANTTASPGSLRQAPALTLLTSEAWGTPGLQSRCISQPLGTVARLSLGSMVPALRSLRAADSMFFYFTFAVTEAASARESHTVITNAGMSWPFEFIRHCGASIEPGSNQRNFDGGGGGRIRCGQPGRSRVMILNRAMTTSGMRWRPRRVGYSLPPFLPGRSESRWLTGPACEPDRSAKRRELPPPGSAPATRAGLEAGRDRVPVRLYSRAEAPGRFFWRRPRSPGHEAQPLYPRSRDSEFARIIINLKRGDRRA